MFATILFLSQPRLILRKIMIIFAKWIIKAPVILTSNFAGVIETSAVQWYEYCRDIRAMKITSMNQSFGGIGNIVEINEILVVKREFNIRSVKEDYVSNRSLSILIRSLVYMIDNLERDTSSI